MDKLKRDKDGVVALEDVPPKQDEIIDWINAQEQYSISLICAKCKNKCKDMSGTNAETCTAFEPSIEQELESGLREANSRLLSFKGTAGRCNSCGFRKCTHIFLPAAKYEEWQRQMNVNRKVDVIWMLFHDIPVFSYSGDEIIFCTD